MLLLLAACAPHVELPDYIPQTNPYPAGSPAIPSVEYEWCRMEYSSLGASIDQIKATTHAIALRDVTIERRWMMPIPSYTGCVVIRATPIVP